MYKNHKLNREHLPECLRQIHSVPKQLYVIGDWEELVKKPRIAIVGSRKITPYGKSITYDLAYSLAAQGIVIVSGLALGVDGVAHQAALDAKGHTIAVLPSNVNEIYPRTHQNLADDIVQGGGALFSEYPEGVPPLRQNFIARNRLVAGLGQGVLITEAAQKSGSLHTANFALQEGKPVMATPGPINSSQSQGAHALLKVGAHIITEVSDVLALIELNPGQTETKAVFAQNENEEAILTPLQNGISDGLQLLEESQLSPELFNQSLTMLEIRGVIKPLGNNHWSL